MSSADENKNNTNNNNNNNNDNDNNDQYVLNDNLTKLRTIVDYIKQFRGAVKFELPDESTADFQIISLLNDITIDFNVIRKIEAASTESVQTKTVLKLWKLIKTDIQVSVMEAMAFVPQLVINTPASDDEDNIEDINDAQKDDEEQNDIEEEKDMEIEEEKDMENSNNKKNKPKIPTKARIKIGRSDFWTDKASVQIQKNIWKKYRKALTNIVTPDGISVQELNEQISKCISNCKHDIKFVIERCQTHAKQELENIVTLDIKNYKKKAPFDAYSLRGYYREHIWKTVNNTLMAKKYMKTSIYWTEDMKDTIIPKMQKILVFSLLKWLDSQTQTIMDKVQIRF